MSFVGNRLFNKYEIVKCDAKFLEILEELGVSYRVVKDGFVLMLSSDVSTKVWKNGHYKMCDVKRGTFLKIGYAFASGDFELNYDLLGSNYFEKELLEKLYAVDDFGDFEKVILENNLKVTKLTIKHGLEWVKVSRGCSFTTNLDLIENENGVIGEFLFDIVKGDLK